MIGMFGKHHLIRQLALFLTVLVMGGTVGYPLIEEGWTLLDGFYMTIITLTTIGFGEVHPLTDGGRMLTVLIVVFGLGAAATIMSQLARLMMEGDLADIWRIRRMEKKLAKMSGHVIICGYGRIGQAICEDLSAMGVQCVVIDRDNDRNTGAKTLGIPCLDGNATSDVALLSAGVQRAAILVAALSNDSDNLFVALAARDLNSNLVVIARGEDKSIETRMLRAGVDRVVYPAQLGGGQIARLVSAELGTETDKDPARRITDVMGYDLQVYRNFNKDRVTANDVKELTGALQIIAHIPSDGERTRLPGPDQVIKEGDALVLLTEVSASKGSREHDPQFDAEHLTNLNLGIPAIDEEHQQILALVKRLTVADPRHQREVIHEVLVEFREYTSRHFSHEEELFISAGYPDADQHIAEHRALTEKVRQLLVGEEHLHRANLAVLLEEWVNHHILEVDRKYADHLQARRAA